MPVELQADPLPLRMDESGAIRVGSSRVTLDVVLADYQSGMSPEDIVGQLDTLDLADVHAAIAYYLRHRAEVDEYLRRRHSEAAELQTTIEANDPTRNQLKATLTSRLTQGDSNAAPS
ncbi:MAG: DUF433 domain-containing protein [Planctomycetes bacterium]|nr:DUF433 domain-containing protein [Planctomycetota bacterium]